GEDGIRDRNVTGVQTCALPIFTHTAGAPNFAVVDAPAGPVDGDLRALSPLVEHREDVRIEGVDAFARVLVLDYRESALPRFALVPLDVDATAGVEACGDVAAVRFEQELVT